MERASELRHRIKQERRIGAGHGQHPFSAELQRRVVAFIRDQRSGGAADHEIVAQLGLSQQTLHRWAGSRLARKRRVSARAALVPVTISRASASAPRQGPTPSTMVVAGPAQMRVAGLTLDELVELWRKLAC
jgi:hypothetical protein